MNLTDCMDERFGEREERAVSECMGLFLGSRRNHHKSLIVECFVVGQ